MKKQYITKSLGEGARENEPLLRKILHPKEAFTLAEVLITLGIIGVAAAMTLPSLYRNIQYKKSDRSHVVL